jgi:hypothetical protein
MTESATDGRGRRVAGFVVFMLGAGLILESPALWYGVVLMGIGAVIFVRGMVAGGSSAELTS